MKKGNVYLIPTLLAENHYEVLPAQVREIVTSLDYFLVEDLRTARRFVSGLKTGNVIESLEFKKVDKRTTAAEIEQLLKPTRGGKNTGVMSEAGCPGVADPGAQVVDAAHRYKLKVIPLTGPSSLLLALMASGFNGQAFCFHGYLPIEKKERAATLRRLEQQSVTNHSAQIFIETPYRNQKLLEAILATCAPDTRLCIARDLTGSNEWIQTAFIREWRSQHIDLQKIPCVFLLQA